MAQIGGARAVAGLLVAVLSGGTNVRAQAAIDQSAKSERAEGPSPRVRTDDPGLAALMLQASSLSPTFQRLLASIHATDGVVYIERGKCGHSRGACLAHWLAVAGPNRVLRVVLDGGRQGERAMVSIAHELRHALEVLDEPGIRSAVEISNFYRRNRTIREAVETEEAIATGGAVEREIKKARQRGSTTR